MSVLNKARNMSTLITDLKGNSKAILAEPGRNDNDLVADEKVAIERLGASKLQTDSVCTCFKYISLYLINRFLSWYT